MGNNTLRNNLGHVVERGGSAPAPYEPIKAKSLPERFAGQPSGPTLEEYYQEVVAERVAAEAGVVPVAGSVALNSSEL